MPLPLAPIALFALRTGTVAATVWVVRCALTPRPGRTDQRAEDALDDLDEGIAAHAPTDRTGQRNLAARVKRVFRWGDGGIEIDAGLMARWRVTRIGRAADGAEASGGDI